MGACGDEEPKIRVIREMEMKMVEEQRREGGTCPVVHENEQ
jgi:hypothetical protein